MYRRIALLAAVLILPLVATTAEAGVPRAFTAVLKVKNYVPFVGGEAKTPKIAVGKIYEAVYSCTSTPTLSDDGQLGSLKGCYEEAWLVKRVGRHGWLLVVDVSSQSVSEWWVNYERIQAIKEYVPRAKTPPPSQEPAEHAFNEHSFDVGVGTTTREIAK